METANAVRGEKGSSRATMKKQPQPARKEKRSTRNGAELNSNSRRDRGSSIHGLRHPKTELESAIQRYVDLYDFAPIAYVSFDRAGRIEEANLAATELLREPRDLLIGRPFAFYVADLDSLLRHLLYCRTSQQQVKTELLLKSRKGEQIPALLLSTPITSTARNGALLYQTAIIDLRDRKMAEEALRAKEAELEAIINRTPFMLTRCSPDLPFRFVSGSCAEMLGRPAEEITGKPIIEIVGKKAFKTILPYAEKVLQGHRVEYETEVSYRAARPRSMHCVYTPDRDGKGNVIGWFGSIIDITQRKRAEDALRGSKNLLEKRVRARTAELHAANRELQDEIARRKGLEGQILEISDREQERLAQELHDGLCQQLTAIGFLARATALSLKNHRVVQTDDLEKIAKLINASVMDAHNIARDLHKEEIDAAGFLPALQHLVDRQIWRTSCQLDLRTEVNIEDDNVASELYRILREALINANKHARATQIVLEVRRLKNHFVFSVSDNGVGFSRKPKAGRGLGFHIMQYRAQSIGARLEFESLKKGGSRVACYLPLTIQK